MSSRDLPPTFSHTAFEEKDLQALVQRVGLRDMLPPELEPLRRWDPSAESGNSKQQVIASSQAMYGSRTLSALSALAALAALGAHSRAYKYTEVTRESQLYIPATNH
jgi:hypothetical protein